MKKFVLIILLMGIVFFLSQFKKSKSLTEKLFNGFNAGYQALSLVLFCIDPLEYAGFIFFAIVIFVAYIIVKFTIDA